MEQEVKTLLLNTLNANESIRNDAEEKLKILEKRKEFMILVQENLMKDKDMIIQQISSIYFANAVKRNLKSVELKDFIAHLLDNLLDLLIIEDKFPKQAYLTITDLFLNKLDTNVLQNIFLKSKTYLGSPDMNRNKAALMLYEQLFKSETLRYSLESFLNIIFSGNQDNIFIQKFSESLMNKNFNHLKMFMKITARVYSHYTLPDYLLEFNVFEIFINLALEIMKNELSPENFGKISESNSNEQIVNIVKMRKWALFFLHKMAYKGLKKYFKNTEFITFIRKSETLETLNTVFLNVINDFTLGKIKHDRILSITSEFFILISGNKNSRHLIKKNYMFILYNFILPIHSYNNIMKETFDHDEEKYLTERYNFIPNNLRSGTSNMFIEMLQSDKEISNNLFLALKTLLDDKSNPNFITLKYGIIGLFADSQKQLEKAFGKENFINFITSYIFPEFYSEHEFIISQALYFVAVCDGNSFNNLNSKDNKLNSTLVNLLRRCIELVNSENEILSVEACLAMNFFFFNEDLNILIKPFIPNLLEKVITYSKHYFLELLGTLMDSIIECFTDEIGSYSPHFTATLCQNILEHIESNDDNKISTISGYITTIEKLIMATDDKPEIVKQIYSSASKVVYYIFVNRKTDFYQEALDIMNSFMFALQYIDESMFLILNSALSIDPDDICLFPREFSDFIDNFLSYGKEALINPSTLESIYKVIEVFIPNIDPTSNDDELDIYEEDFEAGCRIMESLLLNAGATVNSINQNIIPSFIHKVLSMYPKLDDSTYSDIFALEIIMNCFIIVPEVTLNSLGNFKNTFFEDIIIKKHKFKRVHDKKIFIRFIGELFKMKLHLNINLDRLNETFIEIFTDLPEAIKKRNKLKDEEEEPELEEDEYNSEESDYNIDSLEEDIYFETVLDKFNAYEYIGNILSSSGAGSIGETAISRMNPSQIQKIMSILSVKQEEQK